MKLTGPVVLFVGRFFSYRFNFFDRYRAVQVICFFLSEF